MIKKLFILSLILCLQQSHTMKLVRNTTHTDFPAYSLCPSDIQNIIFDFATNNTLAKKPKDATLTVYALSLTNKKFYELINNQEFSDKLIHNFAHKFSCSHETIALYLNTTQANNRQALQHELKTLCCFKYRPFNKENSKIITLNELIKKGADLEFTYNYGPSPKTPLMISLDYNNDMFPLLLKKGANINVCNSHALSALKLFTTYPINPAQYKRLLAQPSLNINQQNKNGETALLRCLIRRRYFPRKPLLRINDTFITMIRDLLTAGADPELANNYGITPLDAVRFLANEEIMLIIQHAIDQKHALIQ